MHDVINIDQAKADIKELNEKFNQFSKDWEEGDGYSYYCTDIAEQELSLVLEKMNCYQGFIFEYNESEYTDPKYDEWYQDQTLSHEDLYSCNVTEDNYGLADAIACDIKTELVEYLQTEIKNL